MCQLALLRIAGCLGPNLLLQTYTNNNGTPQDETDDFKSAWAIFAYEETKGVGGGAPGTIKVDGVWTGIAEDMQNPNVFYVSYGTSTNPQKDPVTGEQESPHPLDLYYSFSTDRGESYVEVTWQVNPDSEGNNAGLEVTAWDWLAKGDPEQGEAQLHMTPDGARFYATWLQEGEEGSDIWFRRIMPSEFSANVAP